MPYNRESYLRNFEKNKEKRNARTRAWFKKNKNYMNEYNAKHPGKVRAANLKRDFGITSEQYDEMLQTQNGLCAICLKPETAIHNFTKQIKNLAVDHDHVTGKVRGLLCQRCNHAIGLVDENPQTLRNATKYLEDSAGAI